MPPEFVSALRRASARLGLFEGRVDWHAVVRSTNDLVLDLTMARHGFRTMLRRKLADGAVSPTPLSLLPADRFGDPFYAARSPAVPAR